MLGVFLVLVAPASPLPAGERPVRVFLRDGSFVQAQAMPEIHEDRVFLRLHPSGMLAVLSVEHVDFDATALAARPVPEEVASRAELRNRGTVSGGSDSPLATRTSEPEVPALELQHPDEKALEDRYSQKFTWSAKLQIRFSDAESVVGFAKHSEPLANQFPFRICDKKAGRFL